MPTKNFIPENAAARAWTSYHPALEDNNRKAWTSTELVRHVLMELCSRIGAVYLL
jgi:hypothetical protein